jgi:hypothetical protein
MFDGPKLPLGRKAPYDPGHAAERRFRVEIKPGGATSTDYSDVLAGARRRRETRRTETRGTEPGHAGRSYARALGRPGCNMCFTLYYLFLRAGHIAAANEN